MTFEASYDVIVVGAGPAGSTAVLYAAEKGASVLLLDKKRDREPYSVCWLSSRCFGSSGLDS